jgi:hypothetical protein
MWRIQVSDDTKKNSSMLAYPAATEKGKNGYNGTWRLN